MRALYAVLLTATVVACASVQPVAVQTGHRCLRCRRSIADTRLAGEIVDQMRAPFPFRTAGCMAVYVKANDPAKFAAIFVTDYKTGKLFDADDAYFVATVLPAEGLRNE